MSLHMFEYEIFLSSVSGAMANANTQGGHILSFLFGGIYTQKGINNFFLMPRMRRGVSGRSTSAEISSRFGAFSVANFIIKI